MSGRKHILVTFGLVLSISLIASAMSVMFASYHYRQIQFDLLNVICSEMAERDPETKKVISATLKEYINGKIDKPSIDNLSIERLSSAKSDILSSLGYHISDFSSLVDWKNTLFVTIGFLMGALLFLVTFFFRNKMEARRIQDLSEYLEQVNMGKSVILSTFGEDDFSKLEDEIYKTVTYLYQTKATAIQAKNDFAENLSNIAHQIKTPITAISLSVQMMKEDHSNHLKQVEKQLLRLTHLEEALLLLSRIDSGTLYLKKNETDVFTLLVLAADNLQELFKSSGTSINIPELGEMMIAADLDWTMEALMNLMKNCMEHSCGRAIHCAYSQNPLYTEILIWDDGKGFMNEDIPHLFERFYRGQNATGNGIGIGLALSKEIIEHQNGTIQAKNKLGGGACFNIRFYRH